MIKTDLVIDVLKIDLLNDNLLEKEITKSLEQFPSLTTSDEESPDSVYNCTLAGKVPLLGKIKLFPELYLSIHSEYSSNPTSTTKTFYSARLISSFL